MKAVFSEIAEKDVVEWGFSTIEVKDEETGKIRHFDSFVEYGSNAGGIDEFVIGDSVGRYVPICLDTLDVLIEILLDLQLTARLYGKAESFIEDVNDEDNVTIY